jgi:hypothetical protein
VSVVPRGSTRIDDETRPPDDPRGYIARSGWALLLLVGAIVALFLPCVIVPYAYGDDYAKLWMAVSGDADAWFGRTVISGDSSELRPLMGVMNQAALSAAGTVDNLRFVRLFAVVGIVGLAVLLHWALVRARIGPMPAALMALFVCSMPAFEVAGSWATLFSAPYAAILGGCASLLAVSGSGLPSRLAAGRLGGAVLALVVGVAGLGLAFVTGKVVANIVGGGTVNADRGALTHDIAGKALWFVEHPLYRSLSLFELRPSAWLAAVVVIVAGGGIVLWLRAHGFRPLPYVLAAVVLVPLSFLPNLIVRENNSYVFRTGIALTSLVALYVCFGVLGLWSLARDWLRLRVNDRAFTAANRLALGLAVALVAVTAVTASRNVTTLMVEPQHTELGIIRDQVAALQPDVGRIGFVQIGWEQGMTAWYSDELGLASSARPWTGPPAVYLILREQGRLDLHGPRPEVDWLSADTPLAAPGAAVIDVRTALAQLR